MSVSLEVQVREVRPRSLRNQLRHTGKIPAILNGYQVDSTPIILDAKALAHVLREEGSNALVTLNLNGQKIHALVHHLQADTFTRQITHAELLSVNLKEATEVEVELNLVGEAIGAKAGGTVAQTLYNVTVSATPENLPDKIDVDIQALNIGDTLAVGDLPTNAHFDIMTDPQEQIVAVQEAHAPIEEEPTEAKEPEVIGETTEEA